MPHESREEVGDLLKMRDEPEGEDHPQRGSDDAEGERVEEEDLEDSRSAGAERLEDPDVATLVDDDHVEDREDTESRAAAGEEEDDVEEGEFRSDCGEGRRLLIFPRFDVVKLFGELGAFAKTVAEIFDSDAGLRFDKELRRHARSVGGDHAAKFLKLFDRDEDEAIVIFGHIAFVKVDDSETIVDDRREGVFGGGGEEREGHVGAGKSREGFANLFLARLGIKVASTHPGDSSNAENRAGFLGRFLVVFHVEGVESVEGGADEQIGGGGRRIKRVACRVGNVVEGRWRFGGFGGGWSDRREAGIKRRGIVGGAGLVERRVEGGVEIERGRVGRGGRRAGVGIIVGNVVVDGGFGEVGEDGGVWIRVGIVDGAGRGVAGVIDDGGGFGRGIGFARLFIDFAASRLLFPSEFLIFGVGAAFFPSGLGETRTNGPVFTEEGVAGIVPVFAQIEGEFGAVRGVLQIAGDRGDFFVGGGVDSDKLNLTRNDFPAVVFVAEKTWGRDGRGDGFDHVPGDFVDVANTRIDVVKPAQTRPRADRDVGERAVDAILHFAAKPEHNRVDDHHNHHANRHAADAQQRDSTRQQIAPYQQQFIHNFPVPSIGLCAFKRDSTTPPLHVKEGSLIQYHKIPTRRNWYFGKKTGFLRENTLRHKKTRFSRRRPSSHNLPYESRDNSTPVCIADLIPFEIPDSWEWARLGEVMSNFTGLSYKKEQLNVKGTQMVRVLRGGNILYDRYVFKDDDVKIASDFVKTELYLKKGFFITPAVSSLEQIGKVALIDQDFNDVVAGGFVLVLRPLFANFDFCKYLYYAFSTKYHRDNCRGVTHKSGQAFYNLSREKLMNLFIPIPPLSEQRRIVAKLEELLPLVEEYGKAESTLTTLNATFPEALKKSILQDAVQGKLVPQDPDEEPASVLLERIRREKKALDKTKKGKRNPVESRIVRRDNSYYELRDGVERCVDEQIPFEIPDSWEWARLNVISEMFTGNSINETEKKKNFTNISEGLNYIATKDVGFDNTINYCNGVKIPLGIGKFRIAPANSVLLCIEGGSAGRKIALLEKDVCFGNKLCCFISNGIDYEFLYYFLQSPCFRLNFKMNETGIIGGVSINSLKQLFIPIPSLSEQRRIVAKLEEIMKHLDLRELN